MMSSTVRLEVANIDEVRRAIEFSLGLLNSHFTSEGSGPILTMRVESTYGPCRTRPAGLTVAA